MQVPIDIRPANGDDRAALWRILEPIIAAGETYALPLDMTDAEAIAYWTAADRAVFVAEQEGRMVGTYSLGANQRGGGAHVANCGYMTDPAWQGRGLGRAIAEHSLFEARRRGFTAMQFNFVVTSNDAAVRLWRSLGFEVVGRLPGAFQHPRVGPVDALVMFRRL